MASALSSGDRAAPSVTLKQLAACALAETCNLQLLSASASRNKKWLVIVSITDAETRESVTGRHCKWRTRRQVSGSCTIARCRSIAGAASLRVGLRLTDPSLRRRHASLALRVSARAGDSRYASGQDPSLNDNRMSVRDYAAAAVFGCWVVFQLQGSNSATLLAG
jgi:hypothetical protein